MFAEDRVSSNSALARRYGRLISATEEFNYTLNFEPVPLAMIDRKPRNGGLGTARPVSTAWFRLRDQTQDRLSAQGDTPGDDGCVWGGALNMDWDRG